VSCLNFQRQEVTNIVVFKKTLIIQCVKHQKCYKDCKFQTVIVLVMKVKPTCLNKAKDGSSL